MKKILIICCLFQQVFLNAQSTINFQYSSAGQLTKKTIDGNTPSLQFQNLTDLCEGDTLSISVSGADAYLWYNGSIDTNLVVIPTDSIKIEITGYDTIRGCSTTMLVPFTLHDYPTEVSISGDSIVGTNSSLTYSVPLNNGSIYNWDIEGGYIQQANNNQIDVVWTSSTTGELKVVETNLGGCEGDTSKLKVVIGARQLIYLDSGVNYISLYVYNQDMSPNTLLNSIEGSLIKAKDEFLSYDPNVPPAFNTLQHLVDGQGYFVITNAADTLQAGGFLVNEQTTTIPLDTNWQLIGFPCPCKQAPSDAFNSILPDVVKVKNAFESYDPAVPPVFNSLDSLSPGQAYWVKLQNTTNFQYSCPCFNTTAPIVSPNTSGKMPMNWKPKVYTNSTVGYGEVTLNGQPVSANDIIAVFIGGESRGTAKVKVQNDRTYVSFVINGDTKDEVVEFRMMRNDTIYYSNYTTLSEPGTTKEGIMPITFGQPTNIVQPNLEGYDLNLFPNPFTEQLTLSLNLPKEEKIKVEIFDTYGRRHKILTNRTFDKGISQIQWIPDQQLSSGIYIITLTGQFGRITKRVQFIQ